MADNTISLDEALEKWDAVMEPIIKSAIKDDILETVRIATRVEFGIDYASDADLSDYGISPFVARRAILENLEIQASLVFKLPGSDKLWGYSDDAALKKATETTTWKGWNTTEVADPFRRALKAISPLDIVSLALPRFTGNSRLYPRVWGITPYSHDLMMLVLTAKDLLENPPPLGSSARGGNWKYIDMESLNEEFSTVLQVQNTAESGVFALIANSGTFVKRNLTQQLHAMLARHIYRPKNKPTAANFTKFYNSTGWINMKGHLGDESAAFVAMRYPNIQDVLFGLENQRYNFENPGTPAQRPNASAPPGGDGVGWDNTVNAVMTADSAYSFIKASARLIRNLATQPDAAGEAPVLWEKWLKFYPEVLASLAEELRSEEIQRAGWSALGLTPETYPEKKEYKVKPVVPFDYQCYLMENIDVLSAYQEYNSTYENIIRLKGDPGTTISKINHGNKTKEVKQLMNLTPAVQALLVPHIKIYRVDYDKDNPMRPIRQQELEIPNFVDPTEISSMLNSGGGRYSGFGLKSFTWSLDGIQPETVENNISANLTFYFQSVKDLFQGSMAAGREKMSPLDLLINPASMKKVRDEAGQAPSQPAGACGISTADLHSQFSHGEHSGATYRIKVVAGWSTPPNLEALIAPDSGMTIKDIQYLKRALRSTRVSLYLQQTRHNLNFQQDGSIELSIDYQAALTGIMTSPKADILGARTKRVEAAFKKIDNELKALGKKTDSTEAKKKKLEAKKKLENEERLQKYKRFLNPLYGRNALGQPVSGSIKMQTLQVNPMELLLPRLGMLESQELRASEALRKMAPNDSRGFVLLPASKTLTPNPGGGVAGDDMLQFLNEALANGNPIDQEGLDKTFESNWSRSGGAPAAQENLYIPYFYLGDLIDLIMEENQDIFNPEDGNKVDYMTFFGEIDIINPLLLFVHENFEELACADTTEDSELIIELKEQGYLFTRDGDGSIKKRINIGSIPISLDLFNVWFKDNVVKPGKDSYYLIRFLKDICGIISDALGKACYGNRAYNKTRFDTSIIHINNTDRTQQPGATSTVDELGVCKGKLDDTNDIAPPGTTDKSRYSAVQGLVLYSTDAKPKSRSGDFGDDLKDGIYHNYLGSSTGLVKSINFNRIDQQYLREAKIQKEGALGAAQLRELYSADLELVGNTLFKNGQYVYIWPTAINTDERVATLLGLGGYFMIKSVKHTISPSGYSVSVSALQEGLKKMGGTTADGDGIENIDTTPRPNVTPEMLAIREARQSLSSHTPFSMIDSEEEYDAAAAAKTKELIDSGVDSDKAKEAGERYKDRQKINDVYDMY